MCNFSDVCWPKAFLIVQDYAIYDIHSKLRIRPKGATLFQPRAEPTEAKRKEAPPWVKRIKFFESAEGKQLIDNSPYNSVDPTPPVLNKSLDELRECFLDERAEIFERYRAMFALRNLGGTDAVRILTDAFQSSKSALLKHEVAYVLGQMQDAHATARLKVVLEDATENPMVRHEAAEAMGSIASAECQEMLRKVRGCPRWLEQPVAKDVHK